MKQRIAAFTVLLMSASSARGQQPNGDALSNYLRRSYAALATNLTAVIEMMPEQDFGFRPAGVVKEVRTFGEIAAHIILTNAYVCAMGSGKPDPTSSDTAAANAVATNKARALAYLSETNRRCTSYLATLTDAALSETVTSGDGPRAIQAARGVAVTFAIAHSNEHYGNLVTYLRAKGLVPPSKPVQALFFSPVAPRTQ